MEHKVHFIVACLGRDCDDFTLHIYASLAEQERIMISERIKAALARSKNKNKLGVRHASMRSKDFRRRLQAAAAISLRKAAMERAEAYRIHIEWALSQPGIGGKPITFNGAGERLNALRIPSPMGGRWSSMNVADIAVRLKLREKPVRASREVLQARVLAIWKRYPECFGQEAVDMMAAVSPIGMTRALYYLRNCRRAAAREAPMHRATGWQLDRKTAARIRICAIWRRHPELTAKQVTRALRSKHRLKIPWVRKDHEGVHAGDHQAKREGVANWAADV
jgi:hypothetical protein